MPAHRPEWDHARLAPISPEIVERLWDHHNHQRLTAHRLQELLSELVELMADPSVSIRHPDDWRHHTGVPDVSAAVRQARADGHPCITEHLEDERRRFLEEVPTHRAEERALHLLPEHLRW